MIELIKLELRKSHQFGLPLKLFGFMTLIVLIILYSYFQTPPLPEFVLNRYENLLALILSVVNVGYMIYMAVLLRRVVLHEYSNRTISQLFLYPISRLKLLSAKVLLVCLWSFWAMFLSAVAIYSLLFLLDQWLHFMLGEMSWPIYLAMLSKVFVHALAATLIGLLPFGIALWRKSGDLLVTIAVMISVVIYSNDGTHILADQPMLQLGLSFLGIVATSYSVYRASQEDIVNL